MKASRLTAAITSALMMGSSLSRANDWTMGDWMPHPGVHAFVIKVVKVTPVQGKSKVHTAVGEIQSVIMGSIDAKRVGIVLPMERYAKPPQIGSEFFVMSGSQRSPYTPIWMMHGFVRLDGDNGRQVIPCAKLSAKFVAAQTTSERATLLNEISAIEKSSCGYEVSSRLPAASCKGKTEWNADRKIRTKEFTDCLKEYGLQVK